MKESKLPINFEYDNPCKGFGRYFFERWIHSHPYVQPGDFYSEKIFKFGYLDIPNGNFTKKLHMAPRFDFDDYDLQTCRVSHQIAVQGSTSGQYLGAIHITIQISFPYVCVQLSVGHIISTPFT